jgi:hypothetical protein
VDHDPQKGTCLYNAVFEKESALEIVAAIKKVLGMPGAWTMPSMSFQKCPCGIEFKIVKPFDDHDAVKLSADFRQETILAQQISSFRARARFSPTQVTR